MSTRSHKREVSVWAADFTTLCAAIERVYYQHRLGTKPPFEVTTVW